MDKAQPSELVEHDKKPLHDPEVMRGLAKLAEAGVLSPKGERTVAQALREAADLIEERLTPTPEPCRLREALEYATVSLTKSQVILDFDDRERAAQMFERLTLSASPAEPEEATEAMIAPQGYMAAPMYDKCDTYVAGQYVFNYLRTFLAAAGIDASKCRLVIELPDRDTQRQLVSAVQRDSKGSPRSAGRVGNHSGYWQGVEYEFALTAMHSAAPIGGK